MVMTGHGQARCSRWLRLFYLLTYLLTKTVQQIKHYLLIVVWNMAVLSMVWMVMVCRFGTIA